MTKMQNQDRWLTEKKKTQKNTQSAAGRDKNIKLQ